MAVLTVLMVGDVMTGRGVDQVLPHPGDPTLRESYLHDARRYVDLAAEANGTIPRPVDYAWPWGDALTAAADLSPNVRVVNLETSITRRSGFAESKGVHYRMSPDNMPCLTAFRPDVCTLANNHVLDFGPYGLTDTLETLSAAGIRTAGAGHDRGEACRPAIVPTGHGTRLLVLACGAGSSGIPPGWAATTTTPGVCRLPDLSDDTAAEVSSRVDAARRPGDVVVVSLHWGSNWGYEVAPEQRRFAHQLVDAGVDVVVGHSSHHPRPVEVYHDRLVIYGCGDFVNDYEGIRGYEEFQPDLRLLYIASLEAGSGRLLGLRMAPMRARRLRLGRATAADAVWLADTLDRVSRPFSTRIEVGPDGMLTAGSA